MNGVLILSMDSGMLLHSQELLPSFGLSSPCDPYQQSGFLYALYSSASAQFGPGGKENDISVPASASTSALSPLQWFTQGHVVWHFHECNEGKPVGVGVGGGVGGRILTALATSDEISAATAQAVAVQLAQVGTLYLHGYNFILHQQLSINQQ
jgi:hypothetical protein